MTGLGNFKFSMCEDCYKNIDEVIKAISEEPSESHDKEDHPQSDV